MYQVKSRVLENKEVSEGYFRLSIETTEISQNAAPGQFVMLRVGNSYDPLLRRPFSIHRINKGSGSRGQGAGIDILYKVIGKGTSMMAHIKAGEMVDLIGPLGRGFDLNVSFQNAVIVGGGIGAAPLLALTEELRNKGKDVTVFLGGRSKSDILCKEEFEQLGAVVKIATDDGSLGAKGFVTEILEQYLGQPQGAAPTHIFSCGPHLMSKKVAGISRKFSIPCQVSLEAHMACGVGACLGCVVKVHSRGGVPLPLQPATGCGCDSGNIPADTQAPGSSYKRVCMEGPVFDAEEVMWD